jgi:hypothetical protein
MPLRKGFRLIAKLERSLSRMELVAGILLLFLTAGLAHLKKDVHTCCSETGQLPERISQPAAARAVVRCVWLYVRFRKKECMRTLSRQCEVH